MMDKLDGKKGDIYNSVTEALYSGKDGIVVVPVAYQREFLDGPPEGKGAALLRFTRHEAECPETSGQLRTTKTTAPMAVATMLRKTSALCVGHRRRR